MCYCKWNGVIEIGFYYFYFLFILLENNSLCDFFKVRASKRTFIDRTHSGTTMKVIPYIKINAKPSSYFILFADDLVSFLSAEILYHSLWFYCVCIYVNVFFALFSFTHKQYGSWWVLITFHAFTQRRPNNTSNQREKLILIILCKANWKMTRERRLIKKNF